MFRFGKIAFALTGLLCTNAFATINYNFQLGSGLEYAFPAQEAVVFSNVFMWTIKASCKVTQSENESVFSFRMLKNSASINGITVTKDNTLDINIHPGDVFKISAPSGVKVELTNKSNILVKASCTAM